MITIAMSMAIPITIADSPAICPLLAHHTEYPQEHRTCDFPNTRPKQIALTGVCHNGTICLCIRGALKDTAKAEMDKRVG